MSRNSANLGGPGSRGLADGDCSWFANDAADVVRALGSDPVAGLTREDAAARLDRHGPNELTVVSGPGIIRRLASQFNQPLVFILLAAVVVTAALQEWLDAAVILAVVLVNASSATSRSHGPDLRSTRWLRP